MAWARWKLGLLWTIVLSVLVAGAGLAEGTTWRQFVAVLCAALITHMTAFLKDHPLPNENNETQPVTPDLPRVH